jgi:cytoskeletal protein RodZ
VSRASHPSSADSPFASAQALDAQVCREVGARLAASRSQRGWTHADVANRLLLSTAQVTGLEHADASAFHNPAFFAAGLRKYARLMAIDCPEAILVPKSARLADAERPPRAIREAAARDTGAAPTRDAKPSRSSVPMEWLAVAAIVVLTAGGMAMYFRARTPPVDVAPVSSAKAADLKSPPHDAPPVDRPEPSLPETLSTSAPSIPAPRPTDPPAAAPPAPVDDGAAGVVTVTKPAWVFVRYGDNSVTQRTLLAGQSLTLTSPPIYLAIGASEGVTLALRERPIDVSRFRTGNEIRIGANDLAALAR